MSDLGEETIHLRKFRVRILGPDVDICEAIFLTEDNLDWAAAWSEKEIVTRPQPGSRCISLGEYRYALIGQWLMRAPMYNQKTHERTGFFKFMEFPDYGDKLDPKFFDEID